MLRVVDALRPRADDGRDHGVDVTLARDTRRTVLLPASTLGIAALEPDRARYRWTVVPEAARAWGRVRLFRTAEVAGRRVHPPPVTVDLADAAEPPVALAPGETPVPHAGLLVVPADAASVHAVETDAFTVPAGAVLAFDVGVHALGERRPLPVGARVSVRDARRSQVVWKAAVPAEPAGWSHARVSLAPFAGRRVRLRFATRPGAAAAAAGLSGVFGEPLVLAPRARPAVPPNVVLISIDTLRARSVSTQGAARRTTPALDALGAEGVVFEEAFSTAAFTLPGHMSMLTGLWFRTHRALHATSILAPEHRTLAEILRTAGYGTAAFTSGAWIMPWTGFRRGFDVYYEQPSAEATAPPPGGVPYEAFTRGLAWMRGNRDRPLFVFLHSYLVHGPHQPPVPYAHMFDALPPPPASDLERALLRYEQEIRYGDDQLRAFLEGLAALGLAERTLVIVTSDHGEQFGEHGGAEHTHTVYDEVAHVPLVMRLPGAIPAGTRIAEPVSIADVPPTVVDLLGLPPIARADGTSLLPLIAGTAARLPRDGVFTEAESAPKLGRVDLAAIHTRSHSCIHHAGPDRVECWDRRRDPWQERPPLPPDAPGAAAARASLARFVASRPPPGVPLPDADAAPAAPSGVVDEERQEQLRALGYVE